ncbi:MAG: zinc-binding dehydrogenase [Pseudomonadota bacterium]
MATMVDQGMITPLIDESNFTLNDVEAAHQRLQSGQATGKVVVEVKT